MTAAMCMRTATTRAAVLAAMTVATAALAADVHVAVTGHDAADGSAASPVASLRRALDRVRQIRAAAPDRATPVIVEVGDGRHELAETLVILPADSGTDVSPTIIQAAANARPVISGGRVIANWQPTAAGEAPRWTAELPDVKAGAWRFSQLFVNDQRRFRPVLPAAGWHTIAGGIAPTLPNAAQGHDRFAFSGDDLRPEWAHLDHVEVVAVHRWTMSRLPIASIAPNPADPATRIVTFAGRTRGISDWCSFPKGNRFLVENVQEALGAPGSWYLDRGAGRLTYCPRDGETPATTTVIAPRLDRLVELRGDTGAGECVSHIRFEGLTFAHGNWNMPDTGQSYPQGDVNVGAAITARAARHTVFSGCAVRHVGRYAIDFGAGCQDCRVERCELVDLGAGGVLIGTVVENNVIHDVVSHEYGGWGLYTDEGSTGIVMRRNLVFRTSSGGFHQHYGRDNTIENNVFAAARDWQIQRSRVEAHTSFRFERNIVWWENDAPLVKGDWTKGLVTRSNCYWHAGGAVAFPDGTNLATRQAAGLDAGSLVADPRCADPSRGDFTLAADSPALRLGFEPLDPAAAGRRSPVRLTAGLPAVPSIWIRPPRR